MTSPLTVKIFQSFECNFFPKLMDPGGAASFDRSFDSLEKTRCLHLRFGRIQLAGDVDNKHAVLFLDRR